MSLRLTGLALLCGVGLLLALVACLASTAPSPTLLLPFHLSHPHPSPPKTLTHTAGSHACVLDLDGDGVALGERDLRAGSTERFLLFTPPPLSALPRVLRRFASLAKLLNRTLVLPHLRSDASERGDGGAIAGYGSAFDVAAARPRLSPLRVLEIDSFTSLHSVGPHLLVLQPLGEQSPPSSEEGGLLYLRRVGAEPIAPLHIQMPGANASLLCEAFCNCAHRAIAFLHSWEGFSDDTWDARSLLKGSDPSLVVPTLESLWNDSSFAPLLSLTPRLERLAEARALCIPMLHSASPILSTALPAGPRCTPLY
ncbi:MAG: hypothetical protein SGPRY_000592 [Prymnesium sp.]